MHQHGVWDGMPPTKREGRKAVRRSVSLPAEIDKEVHGIAKRRGLSEPVLVAAG